MFMAFKEEKKMVTRTECEEAINEICKKCFEKHELEYGHQPVNCAFRAFDNEDCPMVTTLRKLIQEHFDEKKARFGDKKASRKLFCLLDENIKEFSRWIATSKEEAKKEIFELSEMFKDFYKAAEPVYTWTVVSFSKDFSESLKIEHVKASKEQIQEYMFSKIDLEGVDVEISHELNRTVYRSCSECGGKKMIWVVEKCLENDIFDLNV